MLRQRKSTKKKDAFAALIRFTLIRTPPAPRVLRGILVLRYHRTKFFASRSNNFSTRPRHIKLKFAVLTSSEFTSRRKFHAGNFFNVVFYLLTNFIITLIILRTIKNICEKIFNIIFKRISCLISGCWKSATRDSIGNGGHGRPPPPLIN